MGYLGIKNLACFGCSFVEGAAITDKLDRWVGHRYSFPAVLCTELGLDEYKNYGGSGMGNESILRRVYRHFKQDKDHSDTLVVIGLSGITRLEIYSNYQQRFYDNHLFDFQQKDNEDEWAYKRRAKLWLGNEDLWKDFKKYIKIEQKHFFDTEVKQEKLHWQLIHLDGYFKSKGIRYVIFNSVEDNIDPIKKDLNYLSLVDVDKHKDVELSGINTLEDTWAHKLRLDHYYNVNKDFNLNEYKSPVPPYGRYFCNGHPSPNANRELTKIILKYIDENNI